MFKRESGDPTFSLIFLTWNSAGDVERTLDSVLAQIYEDYEVLVVDNDSEDETVSIIREEYLDDDRVRLIQNEENLGFTRGINRGIEASRGEYICCYNDDTRLPPDYLETLVETVTPNAVWTTARINHRVTDQHQCVRLLGWFGFPIPYVVDNCSGVVDVNYVPGDGVIIPRKIYRGVLGGQVFRPKMPIKGEDIDLSLRLQSVGVALRAVLKTHSIHPDEGFYDPNLGNAVKHAQNVYARLVAYRRNGAFTSALPGIAASTVGVPLVIFKGSFPRDSDAFLERVSRPIYTHETKGTAFD